MPLRNTRDRWGGIAKGAHWLVAAIVLTLAVLGWVMVYWPLGPTKFALFGWHKSFGVTVFVLLLLRLTWRLFNPPPTMPADMARWEVRAAQVTHWLLYALLIAMPITGYIINSATNFPLSVFGWFTVPNVVPENEAIKGWAELAHLSLFWGLAALLALHVGGAMRHHFLKGDDVLRRMLPAFGQRRSPRNPM